MTDAESARSQTLAFEVLSTEKISPTADTASIHVADGNPLISGEGSSLVQPGSAPLTVSSAKLGNQLIQRKPNARAALLSTSPCIFSVPVKGSAQGFYDNTKRAIEAKGGSVAGDAISGNFNVSRVAGSYRLDGSSVKLSISPDSLGVVRTCERVFRALSSALAD